MKQKRDQIADAVKTALLVLAVGAGLVAKAVPARATSFGSTGSSSVLTSYPSCTLACPGSTVLSPGFCCKDPDKILEQEFRGSGSTRLNQWYEKTFWPLVQKKILSVTREIVVHIQRETTRRGALLNGQNQIRAITSLQKGSAEAARHQLPDEGGLCRFATLSQSLSASDSNAQAVKEVLAKGSIDRQLLVAGTPGSANFKGRNGEAGETRGQSADKNSRWQEYLTTFCDPSDYGQGKAPSGLCQTADSSQYNHDINYGSAIGAKMTLDIGSNAKTKDATDIAALQKNLYAHDLVNNLPQALSDPKAEGYDEANRKYGLLISAITKRAVAENSFASIAAMKAKGPPGGAKYVQNLMIELGVKPDEAKTLVTENPSYYAQMEALTRKLYQSPSFYVNLMQNPINVKRQQAAMKSFDLMQQRDMYKSLQRSELLMATLLEIKLARQQGGLDRKLKQ